MFKTKKTIKQTYSDAMYWATSNQSKTNDYHLTRTEEAILRKLIHYSTRNEKITYSNRLVAKHTFIDETQVEKAIPRLTKIGYLKTISFTINDGGKIVKRRTINVNWEFLERISNEIPQLDSIENEDEFDAIINDSQINSTIGKSYFTTGQLDVFANFNPPVDEILQSHLKLYFAKDYVLANVENLNKQCKKKYEFEILIENLTNYDINRFDKDLKFINKDEFKEYLTKRKVYIDMNYTPQKSN